MLALPHGAADTARMALAPAGRDQRVARQVRREVRRHGNRPHARPAAAVRDGERLVQVQVADVGADRRRTRQADLRVHVGAVHVHLPAVLVHDRRRSPGCSSSNTPCVDGYVTISAASAFAVLLRAFARRSSTSMLPLLSLATTTTLMPAMIGAGRVGAVRRRRNQHDVAVRVAAIAVVRADRPSGPANSPCAPEFGCSDTAGETGDPAQRRLELAEDLRVALGLIEAGANGCSRENSGQLTGIISDAAFSFIVHEPSGIIEVSSPMSLRSRLLM